MMVLISYDVCTQSSAGRRRLRLVAKKCESRAQRVQNSVFEANLDYGEFAKLKEELMKIIELESDSLRFYYLGNNWHKKIEHVGAKAGYDPEGTLIV